MGMSGYKVILLQRQLALIVVARMLATLENAIFSPGFVRKNS
jgi:hypothetical protein